MSTAFGLLSNVVIILAVGLLFEKWMEHKGKESNIKNINYYLKKGNNFPVAVLKAIGYGYFWFYKTYIKALLIIILSFVNISWPAPDPAVEEEELEEEERVRQEQYNRNK